MSFKIPTLFTKISIPIIGLCLILAISLVALSFVYIFRPNSTNEGSVNLPKTLPQTALDIDPGEFRLQNLRAEFDPMMFALSRINMNNYLINISGADINNPQYIQYFQPLLRQYPQLLNRAQNINFIYDVSSGNLQMINSDNLQLSRIEPSTNPLVPVGSIMDPNVAIDKLFEIESQNGKRWVYLTNQKGFFISEPNFVRPRLIFEPSSLLIPDNLIGNIDDSNLYLIAQPGFGVYKPIIKDGTTPEDRIDNFYNFRSIVVLNKDRLASIRLEPNSTIPFEQFSRFINTDEFYINLNQQAYKDKQEIETDLGTKRFIDNLPGQDSTVTPSQDVIIDHQTHFHIVKGNRIFIQARGARSYFFVLDTISGQVIGTNLPISNRGYDNQTSGICNYEKSVCYVSNFATNNFYTIDLNNFTNDQYRFQTANLPFERIPEFNLNQMYQSISLRNRSFSEILDIKDGKVGIWYLGEFYVME